MHPQVKIRKTGLIRLRFLLGSMALLLLAFDQLLAGAIACVAILLSGLVDGSLGYEISDNQVVAHITDNSLSWGLMIFGAPIVLGVDLIVARDQTTWGCIAIGGAVVAGLYQICVEVMMPADDPRKAQVGALAAWVVVAGITAAAWLN